MKHWTYRMLGIVSPSGSYLTPPSWAMRKKDAPCSVPPYDPCWPYCAMDTARAVQSDTDSVNGAERGTQGC